jgi:lysozyme family protein
MANVNYTPALKAEYQKLYSTAVVKASNASEVNHIAKKILAFQSRYTTLGNSLDATPWQFIAVIHSMEASLNFTKHLHNGDSLKARTVQVPAGRPVAGKPPFTWDESARDALVMKGLDKWDDWSIPGTLYQLERYNGWGYRVYHPNTLSPYLWSYSNHYSSGKYVSDGKWDQKAVSQQCGAIVLLKALGYK